MQRRQDERISVKLRGRYDVTDPKTIIVVNMNHSGVCFLSDKLIEEGTTITFEFKLKNEEDSVYITTRIVWSESDPETQMFKSGARILTHANGISKLIEHARVQLV